MEKLITLSILPIIIVNSIEEKTALLEIMLLFREIRIAIEFSKCCRYNNCRWLRPKLKVDG